MSQDDWVGGQQAPTFKDIRNHRPSTAYEKATPLWRLCELINKLPPEIKAGGSINLVREWSASRKTAARVAGNSRSSVGEIQSAINNMARYWPDA